MNICSIFHLIAFFQGSKAAVAAESSQPQLNLGLILPHSIYNEREYNKAVAQTLTEIQKTKKVAFKFLQKFEFGHQQVHRIMMKVIPSPTGVYNFFPNMRELRRS
jgi:hypothetical protein